MEEQGKKRAQRFDDLLVWQKAHQWVLLTYKYTKFFPKDELFGLTSQLRRAAVSVPANIAEGFKRRGKADKNRFYNIAQASLEECRYYLILSNDLGFGETTHLMKELVSVSKMLDKYLSVISDNTAFEALLKQAKK